MSVIHLLRASSIAPRRDPVTGLENSPAGSVAAFACGLEVTGEAARVAVDLFNGNVPVTCPRCLERLAAARAEIQRRDASRAAAGAR